MITICKTSRRRLLSSAATDEMESMYMVYRAAYDRLANQALARKQCRWPVRPKGHFFEHMIYDYRGRHGQALNGRHCMNFLSEDFMRRVKAMAVGSVETRCV